MKSVTNNRRAFLKLTGGTVALGLVAGCLGGDDDDAGSGGNGGADFPPGEYDFGGWFDNVGAYDGVHDFTGETEVTVLNGAGSAGMDYDPAAILVDAGTTVVWEWTGDGGTHTVTDEDGAFDSGNISAAGETFEYTFDDEGTYYYYCAPHRGVGQKGAVVVE